MRHHRIVLCIFLIPMSLLCALQQRASAASTKSVADVVVYGATPSGIMAAIEAARLHKTVILIEPSGHLGGMMTNGLGASDEFTTKSLGGLPQAFYDTVSELYGSDPASRGGWYFEPHIAEQAFQQMLDRQTGIQIALNTTLESAPMIGPRIRWLVATDGQTFYGKEYIDASYTGDLLAIAGVSYQTGREATSTYNESFAGVQSPTPIIPLPATIDPWLVPGDPSSGLIPHVMPNQLGAPGSADDSIMAYNYRSCFSSDPSNQIPFTPPPGYDPSEFELVLRRLANVNPPSTMTDFFGMTALPNRKFDVNGAQNILSTDEVSMSRLYPNGTAAERLQIENEEKRYMQALFYFVATDPHIPTAVQAQMNSLGYCRDEFVDNGGWPHQIYVREARRMVGAYVFTQSDLINQTTYPDSIGIGGYGADSHYDNTVALDGTVQFEGWIFGQVPVKPYMIPYRILTPQPSQASNLLVSAAVSASHVAYDSLRIEITYMVMGQAAGAAAAFAINENVPVQNVDYNALKQELYNLKAVTRLTPLPATKTALVLSPNTTRLPSNSAYTLTATVSPAAGSIVPKGTILFTIGTVTYSVPVNALGVATYTGRAAKTPGTLALSAAYQGSADFAPSKSGVLNETVLPPRSVTRTLISIQPNAFMLASASPYMLTATVYPTVGTTIPYGNVTFTIGTATHTVRLNSLGVATYSATTPKGPSNFPVFVAYQGADIFYPSQSSVRHQIVLPPVLPASATTLTITAAFQRAPTYAPGASKTLQESVIP